MNNHRILLQKCHEAYWQFPDDTLSSDKRIAALLQVIADSPLADKRFLAQVANRTLVNARCGDRECPVRANCLRHVSPSHLWKNTFGETPRDEEGCNYFWDINEH